LNYVTAQLLQKQVIFQLPATSLPVFARWYGTGCHRPRTPLQQYASGHIDALAQFVKRERGQ
jgi:hypothetical protein